MRNKLTMFFVVLGFSLGAQSILKTSPIALAFGAFNACYEKPTSAKGSIEVSANYTYKIFGEKVGLFGAGVGYRAYLSKKEAPMGLYIMPNVGASFGSSFGGSYNVFDFGALLGYQIVASSNVVFDFGAGPSYTLLGGNFGGVGFDEDSGGVLPNLRLAVGFAFGGDSK